MYKVTSRFIETACKKLVKVFTDYTSDSPLLEVNEPVHGAFVRVDLKVWQDEAGKIDKETIKNNLLSAGALNVDIRIIRVPRENIRAEAVLKAESLKDKIIKMAELRDEKVSEGILSKAGRLEEMNEEDLIEEVSS